MLCTEDKTFRIREAHHSNSLFVSTTDVSHSEAYKDCNPDAIILLDNIPALWEIAPADESQIYLPSDIPIYKGSEENHEKIESKGTTLLDVRAKAAISQKQFDDLWRENGGVEIEDKKNNKSTAYLLDSSVIAKVMNLILGTIETTSELSLDKVSIAALHEGMRNFAGKRSDEPYTVVESVVRKFSKEENVPYSLNISEIIHWYGINTLKEHQGQMLVERDFLEMWRQSLPVNVMDPLKLESLTGNFINMDGGKVTFFTKTSLPNDPKERINQLLNIKPNWELSEILPFIQDIIPKTSKVESFIMKFARKKTVGKKIIISKR